jgi:exonuclease SbcC
MRILAIRGSNLASLPEFSIDFAAEPLNRSGLFAITGKTGAGKSTILDALCIALFDKTPRLAGGGAMVGRPDEKDDYRVNAGDVRSIVRQGTAGGSAEVDFVGRDGHRYRATWQARRARSRADGKFQAQSVSLVDIETSQPLGGTKTETLALIQEKIGLTYEQFRRSVLLAQGEFAAFLRADGKERAELLEKITGTDIYARLSMAAFSRKRSEEQALDQLVQQLGSITILNDDERATAQANLEELDTALRLARERLAELVRCEAWYGRHDQLQESVTAAEKSLLTAREAYQALQPLRDRLQQVEAAERFRPLVAAVDRTQAVLKSAAARREELLQAVAAARTVLETKQAHAIQTAQAVDSALKNLEEAQPQLVKARELDTRLSEGQRQLELRRVDHATALNESEEARKTCASLEAQLTAVTLDITAADAWLETKAWAAPVVAEWERWKAELERYAVAHKHIAELTGQITEASATSKQAATNAETAREALTLSEEHFIQVSNTAAAAEKAAQNVDLAGIRRRIDTEQARLTAAGTLQRIVEDAAQALTEQELADAHILAAHSAIMASDAACEADKTRLPSVMAARDEAEHSLSLARARMDLAGHLAALQEGDLCPLCGSHEHPYRKEGEAVENLLADFEARFTELRDSVSSLESNIAATRAKRDMLAKDLQREQQASAASAAKLEKLRGEWRVMSELFPALSVPSDPAEKAAFVSTAHLKESAAEALTLLRAEECTADELLKAVAPARAALDKARSNRDKIIDCLNKAEEVTRETARSLTLLSGDREKEQRSLAAIFTLLEIPFKEWPEWRTKVEKDSRHFIAEVESTQQLWAEWSDRRSAARVVKDETDSRSKEAAARRELLERAVDEKQKSLHEQQCAVEALQKERLLQFNGSPVEEIERNLSATVSVAREQDRSAAEETSAAEKELTASIGKQDELEKQRATLLVDEGTARAELDRELSVSETAEDEIRELLSTAEEWRTASRDTLNRADVELRDAGTRRDERRDTLTQHLKSNVPAIARDELKARKEAEETQAREREDTAFGIRHTLAADAENRKSAENLLPKIEAQRGITNLWLGISDLIGSADGKKFRVFAQSLTLDLLLVMANEHLASLSPRFSLMRAPSSEMELQVIDRDMGDDIRGVNSISGGESFLVSLALALGLSTLASGTTRIGSLFIDEGFGSLDPETLDTALSTLDALQATGRMVGIISHVSGLAEKIGTRIEVTSTGGGKSCVKVYGI